MWHLAGALTKGSKFASRCGLSSLCGCPKASKHSATMRTTRIRYAVFANGDRSATPGSKPTMTIDQLKPKKVMCGPIFPEPVQVTLLREKAEGVLVSRLRAALERLNPALPTEAITVAVDELTRDPFGQVLRDKSYERRERRDLCRGEVSR